MDDGSKQVPRDAPPRGDEERAEYFDAFTRWEEAAVSLSLAFVALDAPRVSDILPGEVVEEMDRLVERLNTDRPGRRATRTEIADMAIRDYLAANRPKPSRK